MTTAVGASILVGVLSWFAYRTSRQYLPASLSRRSTVILLILVAVTFFDVPEATRFIALGLAAYCAVLDALMSRNYLRVASGRLKGFSLILEGAGLIVLVSPLIAVAEYNPWTIATSIGVTCITASILIQRRP